jgi:hypothetical protein
MKNIFIKHSLSLLFISLMSSIAQAQTAPPPPAIPSPPVIAKVWIGQWVDQSKDASTGLTVDANGNFSFEKNNYIWTGAKPYSPPKLPGCYAFYDGVVSKATLTQKIAPDNASEAVLKRISDDRFKLIQLVCLDTKGDKVRSTDECQQIAMFYDQKSIYRALNCKIGSNNHLMVYPFSKP